MAEPLDATPSDLQQLGSDPPLIDYLRSIYERRDFALSMAQGELRAKHMDTTLGGLWHLLNPVLLTAVYGLVFGLILAGLRPDNFVAYLSIGIFLYSFGQRCVTSGASSIVSNVGLIRSLQFPRALLPLAAVLRETLAFGWSAAVIFTVLVMSGLRPSLSWLLFVPLFGLFALFSLGASLFVARLTDRARDVQNVLPFVFRLGFYASGILFPIQSFVDDDRILALLSVNPYYSFILVARHHLLVEQPFPELAWLSVVVWTVGIMLIGALYFRGGEKGYGRG